MTGNGVPLFRGLKTSLCDWWLPLRNGHPGNFEWQHYLILLVSVNKNHLNISVSSVGFWFIWGIVIIPKCGCLSRLRTLNPPKLLYLGKEAPDKYLCFAGFLSFFSISTEQGSSQLLKASNHPKMVMFSFSLAVEALEKHGPPRTVQGPPSSFAADWSLGPSSCPEKRRPATCQTGAKASRLPRLPRVPSLGSSSQELWSLLYLHGRNTLVSWCKSWWKLNRL